jgi:hypothetical protein
MRLFCLLSLVMIVAACDQPPHAGEQGFACRGGWTTSLCNDGLRCLDGTCVACGSPGETCCSIPGGSLYCNSGACAGAGFDSPGTCSGTCGTIGQACCGGATCPGGGQCVGGQCAGVSSDPCQSGKQAHTINVIAQDCSTYQVTFMTDTPAQAEQCRQQLIAQAGAGQEVCALDTKPNETAVCKFSSNGKDQLYLWNCSDQQLAQCEKFNCGIDCTWSTGDCPQ